MKPVRIQLSRRKGFRLQAASPNGLPVVNVARPSRWGNPYRVTADRPWPEDAPDWVVTHPDDDATAGELPQVFGDRRRAIEYAVCSFRHDLRFGYTKVFVADVRRELRGKNLACWCPLDAECHADVLLEVANG